MSKKKLCSIFAAVLTVVLLFSSCSNPPSSTNNPEDPMENELFNENDIVLSFGAISDVHFTANDGDEAEQQFRRAVEQLRALAQLNDADGLDGIAIAGDITDGGTEPEVIHFSNVVEDLELENVMVIPGNHDHCTVKGTLPAFYRIMDEKHFQNDLTTDMFRQGVRHCVLNGSHFIFIEPTLYNQNCPFDKKVVRWLDETLAEITQADPEAYVFLFTHPMIYDTCYGSDMDFYPEGSWYTKDLTETLSKYSQVMTFSGHYHFPINDERSIMQTSFTSISCGSVRYGSAEPMYNNMETINGYKFLKDRTNVSTGHLVQVDSSGNVRITRMNFGKNDTFKEAWVVPHPTADGKHLEYYTKDRANSNQAPTMVGTPTLNARTSASSGKVLEAKLTFTAGSDDDLVHHYKVVIKNKDTGAVTTESYLSDFYSKSNPEDMAKEVTFDIGIKAPGNYTIDVYAVDSWDAESNKISCDVTI